MKKVYITRRLQDEVVKKLKQKFEVSMWDREEKAIPRKELLERVQGVDGILCMLTEKIDNELLDAAGANLKTISTMSVGFDHVDTEALETRGITLGYTPEVLSDSVADLTIALMLNAGRRLPEAARAVSDGQWGAWSPYWMTGQDLAGSTVGIIGMGNIGSIVAKRLTGFDCRILYYSRSEKKDVERSAGAKKVELEELLESSDFVSIHAPLTSETGAMCSNEMFAKMKPSAVFVNTSRGGLVDQEALYHALSSGQIYAAGLDVTTPEPLPTDSPLLSLDNCIVLPHIGSASIKTRDKMGQMAADNLIAGLEDKPFVHQVKMKNPLA